MAVFQFQDGQTLFYDIIKEVEIIDLQKSTMPPPQYFCHIRARIIPPFVNSQVLNAEGRIERDGSKISGPRAMDHVGSDWYRTTSSLQLGNLPIGAVIVARVDVSWQCTGREQNVASVPVVITDTIGDSIA
jgi:hypothetical protein